MKFTDESNKRGASQTRPILGVVVVSIASSELYLREKKLQTKMRQIACSILLLAFVLGSSHAGFFMNNSPLPKFSKDLSFLLNQVIQHIQSLESMNLNQDAYAAYVDKYMKQASDDIEQIRVNYAVQNPAYNSDIFMISVKAQKQLGTWFEQIFPGRKCLLTDAIIKAASTVLTGPAMSMADFGYPSYPNFSGFRPFSGYVPVPVRTPLAEFNSPLFSFAVGKK